MNNYERNYLKIVNLLIEESFPLLRERKILIKEKDTLKYRTHVKYSPLKFKIFVSIQLRKFPLWKIKRILIHELCHLEIFLEWGLIKTNLNLTCYLFSQNCRMKVEREANILMIKKGYGKLVLTALKENKKRGLKYSLNEEQIKSYAQKIRKCQQF